MTAPTSDEVAGLIERPIISPPRISDEPEWSQVVTLFRMHGLGDPPVRLRDELVGWLVWARYGQSLIADKESGEAMREALKPFADLLDVSEANARATRGVEPATVPDTQVVLSFGNVPGLNVGHFRRARAALQKAST